MTRKVRIGITRDMFDKDGVFFTPGPGLKLLDEMPNVEWKMFPTFQPVITAEQVKDFDIVISLRPEWTRQGLADSAHFVAVLRSGVGFDDVNVPEMTELGIISFIKSIDLFIYRLFISSVRATSLHSSLFSKSSNNSTNHLFNLSAILQEQWFVSKTFLRQYMGESLLLICVKR